MTDLRSKSCKPCKEGTPPLGHAEIERLLEQVDGWEAVDDHHLHKEYEFGNFRAALAFVNRVGELAESEGHHPDIFLTWGRVGLKIWTHAAKGLTENDFILAAKADELS